MRMAILLQSRGEMKGAEIAAELEVSERQVRKYRMDLEEAGLFINSRQGAYGGYELLSKGNLLGLHLQHEDVAILEMINEQLKFNNDLYSSEFNNILDKLRAHLNKKSETITHMSYFTIQPRTNYDTAFEKQKYRDIYEAYLTHQKIWIKYYSLASGEKERIVHPYGLFYYKGDLYLVAYCEKRKNFIDFKVCRVRDYKVLEEKFIVDKSFSWKKYSGNTIGIYKDEEIEVVLKIFHPFAVIVKEKIWVENQQIQELENGSILFRAKMKGYKEIKSWILSMGAKVKVLSPDNLRQDILAEIESIKNLY